MPSAHSSLHALATNHTSRLPNGVTPPQLSQFNVTPRAGIKDGDNHCKWEGCTTKCLNTDKDFA